MATTREPNTSPTLDGSHGSSVDRLANFEAGYRSAAQQPAAGTADWALSTAKICYESSTDYIDSGLRGQWERAERAFQSRHRAGSKYLSATYRPRSKLFRPKTRAMIRANEAQAAASFFGNEDVVSVRPLNANNSKQAASADINRALLQHRLTSPDPNIGIRWYQTCMGAMQDALKNGVVCSKQYWRYEYFDKTMYAEMQDDAGVRMVDAEGRPILNESLKRTVVYDKPEIDIYPIENVRIDRAADWRDPVNSSPYVILLQAMYVADIEARAKRIDPLTGKAMWRTVDRQQLVSAKHRHVWDSTRSERENGREDPKASDIQIDDYTAVWIHENFVKRDGVDWVYYTAGVETLLSDPRPIEEVYLHAQYGDRPVIMGCSLIETHRIYPAGKPALVGNLQDEANDIANLRLDNVKLAMNKRYLAKRGKVVDLKSIVANVPGSVTLVNDPNQDVKVIETNDVTGSSYEEQNRINIDFDEVAGQFSSGTVAANRHLNETVGGMQMLSGPSNLISEMDLRTFTETWAEPVLRQVARLEQMYESDVVILGIAAEQANLFQHYGVSKIDDDLLNQDLTLRVNVGIGATDPMQRLSKFQAGATIVEKMFGETIMKYVNVSEVLKEIFAPLGFRDGSRFFTIPENPQLDQAMQMIDALKKELESDQMTLETKERINKLNAMSKLLMAQEDARGRIAAAQLKDQGANRRQMVDVLAQRQARRENFMSDFIQTIIGKANGGTDARAG